MDDSQASPPPDAEALMEEIRKRVAQKKAAGLYSMDALVDMIGHASMEPFAAPELAEVARRVDVMPDFQLARSTKRGVGGLVSRVKAMLSRATSQPLIGMGDQQSKFNATTLSYLSTLGQEVAVLRAEVDALKAGETAGRE